MKQACSSYRHLGRTSLRRASGCASRPRRSSFTAWTSALDCGAVEVLDQGAVGAVGVWAAAAATEEADVPRLAVGVYATSASTPLFFAQAIGRFVRSRRTGETASVFVPRRCLRCLNRSVG